MHEERQTKTKDSKNVPEGAVPAYLLDREGQSRAKVLSNMIKQKRKEKAVSIQQKALIVIIFVFGGCCTFAPVAARSTLMKMFQLYQVTTEFTYMYSNFYYPSPRDFS